VIKSALRIGCVLSGGQAAGGHNVIVGIYEYIKRRHVNSQLFGFLNGPIGIYEGKYVELRDDTISFYKNRGGFDMICSGRNKI
jgi:6-phosphofructokinase